MCFVVEVDEIGASFGGELRSPPHRLVRPQPATPSQALSKFARAQLKAEWHMPDAAVSAKLVGYD
jgi:hypothetical protein